MRSVRVLVLRLSSLGLLRCPFVRVLVCVADDGPMKGMLPDPPRNIRLVASHRLEPDRIAPWSQDCSPGVGAHRRPHRWHTVDHRSLSNSCRHILLITEDGTDGTVSYLGYLPFGLLLILCCLCHLLVLPGLPSGLLLLISICIR